jgi:hypothetical protein
VNEGRKPVIIPAALPHGRQAADLNIHAAFSTIDFRSEIIPFQILAGMLNYAEATQCVAIFPLSARVTGDRGHIPRKGGQRFPCALMN